MGSPDDGRAVPGRPTRAPCGDTLSVHWMGGVPSSPRRAERPGRAPHPGAGVRHAGRVNELDGLTKRYRSRVAVDGLTVTVEPGHRLLRAERLGQDDDEAPAPVGARHGAPPQR